jgi:hypothetical protein
MNPIIRPIIFWTLLLSSCGYALWRGRRYERSAAIVFISATVASVLLSSPYRLRYLGIETGDLFVDSAVLIAVLTIALLSDRFWPLWVAGLQLVDSLSHVMKAVDMTLIPRAYAAAERFWSYPILIILFIGAWRQQERLKNDQAQRGG